MGTPRRWFGDWELYPGRPASLGHNPDRKNNAPYQVFLRECQTLEGYEATVKHLKEKVGFDVGHFRIAIDTLRAEGKYLKPYKEGNKGRAGQ